MQRLVHLNSQLSLWKIYRPISTTHQVPAWQPFVSKDLTDRVPDPIHLWKISLLTDEDLAGHCSKLLSADERDRTRRFKFPHLQRRYSIAHGQLRSVLAIYLGLPPEEIRLQQDKNGKPFIAEEQNPSNLTFSLSGSGEYSIAGIACNLNIGVDIEPIRPLKEEARIVSGQFSPAELSDYQSTAKIERSELFFRQWTMKEAVVKAIGKGLLHPLQSFYVNVRDPEVPAENSIQFHNGPYRNDNWVGISFMPEPGYVGAAVLHGLPTKLPP